MFEDNLPTNDRNVIRELLAKRSAEFENVNLTFEKAASIYCGDGFPTPFDVWKSAAQYLAENGKDELAIHARMALSGKSADGKPLYCAEPHIL